MVATQKGMVSVQAALHQVSQKAAAFAIKVVMTAPPHPNIGDVTDVPTIPTFPASVSSVFTTRTAHHLFAKAYSVATQRAQQMIVRGDTSDINIHVGRYVTKRLQHLVLTDVTELTTKAAAKSRPASIETSKRGIAASQFLIREATAAAIKTVVARMKRHKQKQQSKAESRTKAEPSPSPRPRPRVMKQPRLLGRRLRGTIRQANRQKQRQERKSKSCIGLWQEQRATLRAARCI